MSGTSGTQSTKGETTSSKSSKSGYDHLDINKLYKGKSTEPVAKTVTQKHGMQALGKALPARRGGTTVVKSETLNSDVANSSAPTQPTSLPPNIGQTPLHPPGWSNTNLPHHPQGPPSPHNAPNVPSTGPPMHDKNWSGGPDRKGNFQSAAAQDSMQRFAQEFPSLDSGGDTGKGSNANASGPPSSTPGHPQMSKSNQDNQYGPGPILRPQTEGSWTQGGGRGMPRPPGPPPPPGAPTRDFGPERPNLGGPTPPPMSVGQGGHPPPPLGFPMQFPPRPPYMYPNAGPPPGPGNFYPPGPGPRYGMPIPPGAPPPPTGHPPDGPGSGRGGRGPVPHQMRPASHFTSKPIIKQEELERMDELGAADGGWATVQDDIDYNKKISFSDDEGEDKGNENSGRGVQSKSERLTPRQDSDKRGDDDRDMRRTVKILERQQPPALNERNEREQRDRDSRFEQDREPTSGRYDYENEDDWKRKPAPGFEQKDRLERDRAPGRGRMREEESWRSVSNNRFDEDPRAKKGPAPVARMDPRGPPDFGKQFPSNLPPRLQRQQHQQPPMFTQSTNQRKTPSPVPTSGSGNAVNKEREFRGERDREWDRERERERDRPTYKILERNRGDSESSKDSSRDLRDRRFGNSNDNDRLRDKPDSTKRLSSDSGRGKDEDDSKAPQKEKGEQDSTESYHGKQDDSKLLFRSKPPFTSSWADEVDDEEYSMMRDEDDSRKNVGLRDTISSHIKRDQIYPEERRPRETTVPRRVIIQQTKVENMRSDVKPEPVPEPKPEPVKIEKPVEKAKSSAWGDRDSLREKTKTDDMSQKDVTPSKEGERDAHSAEKDGAAHRTHKPDAASGDLKSEAKEAENDKSHGGLERKGSREKIERDRHFDRYGGGRYDDRRQQDKDSRDNRNNNLRDNRQKPRRMDSYESKRDNRTPDRDQYGNLARNSTNENTGSSLVNRNSQEKEQSKPSSGIDKSKSGDRLDSLKENKVSEKADKDDFRRDPDKEKDYDRPNRNDRDDYDNSRGHRGGGRGGKERGGYGGVYQPRGGSHWGSDPKGRRGGRGGSSRDFYDSKPRRMDMDREDKPYGRDEPSRHSESDKDKSQDKLSDLSNRGSAEDLGGKKKDKDAISQSGASDKKSSKTQSPGTARRNARGGARLQGYGPPSDKNPFSSNQHKDEDGRDKSSGDSQMSSKPAPVPLMALGDISPPNLQSKSRHHGSGGGTGGREVGGGRGGRGMPPRMQRDDYSFRDSRGGGGNKRGGRSGDAKPLMSINSNEVEGNEWESESESGDDESKRSNQHSRKEGSHHHQASQESNLPQQHGPPADITSENIEADLQKKNLPAAPKQSSDKSNVSSGPPKSARQQQEIKPSNKDRRIKNPPYDPRPNSKQQNQTTITGVGTWEKSMPSAPVKETAPQQPSTHSNTSTPALVDNKDIQDSKPTNPATVHPPAAVSNASILDANSGPLKTMIFENTNFKSITNNSAKVVKPVEPKKESGLSSNLDLGKDLQLGFGKVVGEETTEISFSSFNDNTTAPTSVTQQPNVQSQPVSKTMPIGQSRSYVSHQPSPISPQAADLNEKVQSVKRIWEMPTMPSVAEQNSVCGSEDNSFHGGFGSDSFKGSDSSGREFSSSLQQPTSGYAPGSSPALSAISKPESSSSPTSSNLRMSKAQQQSGLDNQGQSGISSSPFGYTMAQPQGSNAFSSMPAVPSPPSVMYGTSQTLHSAGPPSGMYQTFPHVDAPQVMGATGRGQYQQYPTHNAATSSHYGLFLSTPMEYPSMSSYQHQQGNQGPQQQAPSQSTRISPGPMTTSGGGNSTGVIISSANSLMNMKQQTGSGSHPSLSHQGHQVVPGSQQGYSQLSHHHPPTALSHPQHHLGAVGPAKGGYSQSGIATQSQAPVFIPFDPSQSVINIGQSFLSSAMSSGPRGGPPPPATPPVQALQSSAYYSGSSGNQSGVYPTGSNQGGSLQQLHVAVAPNPQGLPGIHSGNPQYGLQYPTQLNLQGFNQQAAASTVSALNLSNQLIRNPAPGSHSYMKQPGLDLVQQAQLKNTHDPNMMSQNTWNSAGFSMNQSFHASKSGGSQDRNPGNNIGNQRKGNSHTGNVGNMKYMPNQGPGGYSGQVQ